MAEPKLPIIVAIDGPAGAGKSTVAREVAKRLGFALVDTGAIYRAVGLLALRAEASVEDEMALFPIVDTLDISFAFENDVNRVFVAGEDVTSLLRSEAVSRAAATLSTLPRVRAGLLALQRRLGGEQHAVLEGRDIGTVVFPRAQIKVFLHATLAERARRRHEELLARNEQSDYAQVLEDVRTRDASDEQRKHAPLKAASDAILLDCTTLSVEEVIARIIGEVRHVRPELVPAEGAHSE